MKNKWKCVFSAVIAMYFMAGKVAFALAYNYFTFKSVKELYEGLLSDLVLSK